MAWHGTPWGRPPYIAKSAICVGPGLRYGAAACSQLAAPGPDLMQQQSQCPCLTVAPLPRRPATRAQITVAGAPCTRVGPVTPTTVSCAPPSFVGKALGQFWSLPPTTLSIYSSVDAYNNLSMVTPDATGLAAPNLARSGGCGWLAGGALCACRLPERPMRACMPVSAHEPLGCLPAAVCSGT